MHINYNGVDYIITMFRSSISIMCRNSILFEDIHAALIKWGEDNTDLLHRMYPQDMECIAKEGQSLFGFGSPHIHECGWKVKYEFDTDKTLLIVENIEV